MAILAADARTKQMIGVVPSLWRGLMTDFQIQSSFETLQLLAFERAADTLVMDGVYMEAQIVKDGIAQGTLSKSYGHTDEALANDCNLSIRFADVPWISSPGK